MIKPLIECVVARLIEHADKLQVQVVHEEEKTIVKIAVAGDDFKRVIGKDGRIVKVLRTMVGAFTTGQQEIIVDIAQ